MDINPGLVAHLVAGTTAGVVTPFVVHPLDLVKTRLQVQDGHAANARYRGLVHAFRTIVREEGWRALYQGVQPNAIGSAASWGSYFFFYNKIKTVMAGSEVTTGLSNSQNLLAGTLGGLCTLAMTNPIWVVKTRFCLQSSTATDKYTSMTNAFVRIAKTEGIPGLYRGLLPGAMLTTHGGLQFMAYERYKLKVNKFRDRALDSKMTTSEYLLGAALSKIFAGTLTFPLQVVRVRLQQINATHPTLIQAFKHVLTANGPFGFFHGLTPYLVRVMPATCVTFLVYENVNNWAKQLI